jgi:hypothetical protein
MTNIQTSKDDFVFEKEIGEGSFSRVIIIILIQKKVYQAIHKPSGKKFATKIIQKSRVIR